MAGILDKLMGKGEAKGNPSDAKKIAPVIPGGKTIRNRNGYGAYKIERETQGLPALSLADWLSGAADADEANSLTSRLK